jgi:hypothetical protein
MPKRDQPEKIGDMIGRKTNSIKEIYESALLSLDEDIPKPEPVFGVSDPRHGDVFVGTKGNISLFKGSKKARKTFAISAVAAVVAGDKQIIQFKSLLGRKGNVLYVDTEQGKYDCHKVFQREMIMSGLDKKDVKKHIKFITLRGHNPATRKDVVEYAIETLHTTLDLVIIDGIRDLITSINDEEQSTTMVTDLMRWSGDFNIHILSVLHENKGNASSRGVIGTELDNKSESIVRIVKAENDDNYSAIESEAMRGDAFDPYLFTIDDDGLPEMADGSVVFSDVHGKSSEKNGKTPKPGPKGFQFDDIEKSEHIEIIKSCYINESGMFDVVDALSARKFQLKLKAAFALKKHKVGDHKTREFTEKYLDIGLIKDENEDEEGKAKKLVPGFDDEMPF